MLQTSKGKHFTINSIVAWVADMRSSDLPSEVGIVLENNIAIEGNNYKFVRVLWNTGNISNAPINLIREVKTT